MFRRLRADEIDIRVAMCREDGVSLLLYKDARCDMNILDETVGPFNWQREHTRNNANCIVSIYDSKKEEWVSKEDTGTESFTEKEKGLASDSFKRACFNWGIGRELYTSPFIWVRANQCELYQRNGKWQCKSQFKVDQINYNERGEIVNLIISTKGHIVFRYGSVPELQKKDVAYLKDLLSATGKTESEILGFYKLNSLYDLQKKDFENLKNRLNAIIDGQA